MIKKGKMPPATEAETFTSDLAAAMIDMALYMTRNVGSSEGYDKFGNLKLDLDYRTKLSLNAGNEVYLSKRLLESEIVYVFNNNDPETTEHFLCYYPIMMKFWSILGMTARVQSAITNMEEH
ncbi:hypothetical protein QJS10_CPB12g00359 [Acorus calamus]|uniref:Uncharacterized protein n=1 Tax=Acorus calamus TaxID=4465 RepID=A0AAV9DKZ5_ACOCL|nr:hypothetical protein QJS10_CPB12g00359 [Acorus calamus]